MRIELNSDSDRIRIFNDSGVDITRDLNLTNIEISQSADGILSAQFYCLVESVNVVDIPEENIEYTMLKSHECHIPHT